MAGRLDGEVLFITGAARGQGRSHALRFAEEGAGVIGIDICVDIPNVGYSLATRQDPDASGTGRELGRSGMDQFANIRTYGIAS